jgi:hypothetical protein
MSIVFINNFTAKLVNDVSVSDTTFVLDTPLPALNPPDYFLLTLFNKSGAIESGWEIVKVIDTGVNGGATITVQRAQEGTTAGAFAAATKVEMRLTAGVMTDVQALKVDKDSSTGAAQLPSGTSAQRPADGPAKLRFNTDIAQFEGNKGGAWDSFAWSSTVNLVDYTASNVTVASNQSHTSLITNADPSWYTAHLLHVTPSDAQARYTISIYNGDASQSSVVNDKSNLTYLSANNSGELLDSVPFTINGSSNTKSIVISNTGSVDNTFNVVLTATRHSLPTTAVI